jgi:hypothetical protein
MLKGAFERVRLAQVTRRLHTRAFIIWRIKASSAFPTLRVTRTVSYAQNEASGGGSRGFGLLLHSVRVQDSKMLATRVRDMQRL